MNGDNGRKRLESLLPVIAVVLFPLREPISRTLGFNWHTILLVSIAGLSLFLGGFRALSRYSLNAFAHVGLLVAIAISAVGAAFPEITLRYLGSVAAHMLSFWIVVSASESARDVHRVLRGYVAVALIASVVVISQASSFLKGGGEVTSASGFFSARAEYAFFATPAVLVSAGLSLNSQHSKLAWAAAASCLSIALLASFGRTSTYIVCALVPVLLIIQPGADRWTRVTFVALLIGALMAAVFLLLPRAAELWAARYLGSIENELEDEYGSAAIRVQLNDALFALVRENPMFGVGGENFRWLSDRLIPNPVHETDRIQPHNTYLGALAELGLWGLGWLLLSICVPLYSVLRCAFSPDARKAAISASVGLAGASAVGYVATFDALTIDFLWFILGLCAAASNVDSTSEDLGDVDARP